MCIDLASTSLINIPTASTTIDCLAQCRKSNYTYSFSNVSTALPCKCTDKSYSRCNQDVKLERIPFAESTENTWKNCSDLCVKSSGCNSFSWSVDKSCSLFEGSTETRTPASGSFSGLTGCLFFVPGKYYDSDNGRIFHHRIFI